MSKASVIVAFYNQINYLKLVLAGFERQSYIDFELIIADDGSNDEVVNEITKIKSHYSFPIKHIWHEDNGFRKNKILNEAISISDSDYLIFIDGDCIPHHAFIEGHLNSSEVKTTLTGRRVNLSQRITDLLTEEKVRDGFVERNIFRLISDGLFGGSVDVEKGLYLKNKYLLKLFNKKSRGLLGCNFSLFKDDLVNINGFDERYESPSIGEDSDVQFRLELSGVKIKSINHAAVQYHLFHTLQQRNPQNLRLFEETKRDRVYFALLGLKK